MVSHLRPRMGRSLLPSPLVPVPVGDPVSVSDPVYDTVFVVIVTTVVDTNIDEVTRLFPDDFSSLLQSLTR